MSILSENLKYYRSLTGKTTLQLEQETGIAHQTYTGWELGNRQPRKTSDLQKVAEALGVSVDILYMDRGVEHTIEIHRKRSEQEQKDLIAAYQKLNAQGRARMNSYLQDLLDIDRYTREDEGG